MTNKEATEILAKVHQDTYDNTQKILDECTKIHKENLNTRRLFGDTTEEITSLIGNTFKHTKVYANDIKSTIKYKSCYIIAYIIIAIISSIFIGLILLLNADANKKEILSNIEPRVEKVQTVIQEPLKIGSQQELEAFLESSDIFLWSETTIKTFDDLTSDYTIMYAVLGDKMKTQYVTNDKTATLYGLSPDNTLNSIAAQFDMSREHNIKKRISKCPEDIWIFGQIALHKGDVQVEYYDLR